MKGHCSVSEQEAINHPEYMCDAGEMIWDIRIDKKISYNVGYGASKVLRKINAFEMFWHGGTGFGEIKLFQKQGKERVLIDHIKIENAGCEYGDY